MVAASGLLRSLAGALGPALASGDPGATPVPEGHGGATGSFDRLVRVELRVSAEDHDSALRVLTPLAWRYDSDDLVEQPTVDATTSTQTAAPPIEAAADREIRLEIPVVGSRFGAVDAAVRTVRTALSRAGVTPLRLDAWLRSPQPVRGPAYHVYRGYPRPVRGPRRWLRRLTIAVGLRDVGTVVFADPEEPAAHRLRAVAAEVDQGSPLALRPASSGPASGRPPGHPGYLVLVCWSLLQVAALYLGWRLATRPTPALPLLAGATLALALAQSYVTARVSPRRRLHWSVLAVGFTLTLSWQAVGALAAALGPRQLWWPVVAPPLVFVTARGLWHFVRASGRVRGLSIGLPVVLPFAAPYMTFFGQLADRGYLEQLSVRVDEVSVTMLDEIATAARPLLTAVFAAAVVVALAGWARQLLHLDAPLQTALLALTVHLGLATALAYGSGAQAGAELVTEARALRTPAAYHGLRPVPVCVDPVRPLVPSDGGRLPTDRPVLRIGTANGRLVLFDPIAGVPIRVFVQDARLVLVRSLVVDCS